MAERAKDAVIRVQRGSLYPAVERLAAAGLIEPVQTNREGRRPERTVYQITELGRDVVDDWLLAMLREPQTEFPEFPAALAFLALVTPIEAASALEHRVIRLASAVAGMEAMEQQMRGELPRLFYIESEFQHAMLAAELAWVRTLVADIRSGALNWNAEILESWAAEYARVAESHPRS